MFIKTQFPALSLGFPDVCKILTPAPVPTPLPNLAISATAIPTVPNIFISGMPAHNLATTTPISTGNEASAPGGGGVVSSMIVGAKRNLLGSFKVLYACLPVTRLLDPALQNGVVSNTPGINLSPSQVKVLVLS